MTIRLADHHAARAEAPLEPAAGTQRSLGEAWAEARREARHARRRRILWLYVLPAFAAALPALLMGFLR